jgi:hypothetical protein
MGTCVSNGLDFFNESGVLRVGVSIDANPGLEFVDGTATTTGGKKMRVKTGFGIIRRAVGLETEFGVATSDAMPAGVDGRIVHVTNTGWAPPVRRRTKPVRRPHTNRSVDPIRAGLECADATGDRKRGAVGPLPTQRARDHGERHADPRINNDFRRRFVHVHCSFHVAFRVEPIRRELDG